MGSEVTVSQSTSQPYLQKIHFKYINPIKCTPQQFPEEIDQIQQRHPSQQVQIIQSNQLFPTKKKNLSKFALKEQNSNDIYETNRQLVIDKKNKDKQSIHKDRLSIDINNREITERIRRQESKNSMIVQDDENLREIKIKWNSFVKLKNKDYLTDYFINQQIGKGGFGCVYKAQMKYTGILRAAKKIPKKILKTDETQRLFAEMAIMMSLDHPNIVKLYEVFEVKSHYMLMMELCEGGQLYNRIVSRNIKEKEAKKIIKQLVRALIYIHSQGIVHRDLKPQNMLFQKQTEVLKIIDFGIAVKKQPRQMLSQRLGTPYYIAPEVIFKKYDEKCDLWAVGVILYMMITGYPPFRGENQNQVLQSVLRDQVMYRGNVWNKISHQCQNFIKNLLQKNPKDRMSAHQAFNHPWLLNIQQYQIKQKKKQRLSKSQKKQVYNKVSTFQFKNCLQAVVHTYIVSQLLTNIQRAKLLEYFKETDTNCDGVISKDQLMYILKNKTDKSVDIAKIQRLLNIIDTNQSGKIDYTEFLVATIDPKQITKQHLQRAFSYFDIDHSGTITIEQITQFLSSSENAQSIKKLFDLVDENSDGFISKQEFVKLMQQFMKDSANN